MRIWQVPKPSFLLVLQKMWIKRKLLTGLSKVMNHAVTGIVLQHSPITVHKLIWILSIVVSQQASCPPSKWLWQGEDKIWDLRSHLNCYTGITGEGWGNGVIASSRDLNSLIRVSIVHICEVTGDVISIGQHNKATILIPYLQQHNNKNLKRNGLKLNLEVVKKNLVGTPIQ